MRELNFFEPILSAKKRTKTNIRIAVYISLFLVISLTGFFGFNLFRIKTLEASVKQKREYLDQPYFISGLNTYNAIKLDLKQKDSYLGLLTGFRGNNVMSVIVRHIEQSAPKNLQIRSMSISTNITMQITSESKTAIAEFEHNLKKFALFDTVFVNIINNSSSVQDELERYTASVSIEFVQ